MSRSEEPHRIMSSAGWLESLCQIDFVLTKSILLLLSRVYSLKTKVIFDAEFYTGPEWLRTDLEFVSGMR